MDKVLINSQEIVEFLNDVKENGTVEILEDGKQINDLIARAKKRGIDLKGNVDLGGLKLIYAPADKANLNRCRLPREELFKKLHTLIGKPLDVDHDRKYVIGNYIDVEKVGNNAVAYATVFKSNFEDEWKEMQKMFKKGKLTHSFEIWSPEEKRIKHNDGTYDLMDMTLAGGGIMFKNKPAFPESRILNMAKKQCVGNSCLVYANVDKKDLITSTIEIIEPKVIVETKETWICPNCGKEIGDKELYMSNDNKVIHKPCNGEIILPKLEEAKKYNCECINPKCGWKTTSDKHCKDIVCKKCGGIMRRAERPGPGQPKKSEEKAKCSHCGKIFDYLSITESGMGWVKCPECGEPVTQKDLVVKSEVTTIEKPDEKTGIKTTCQNCNYVFEWDKVLEFKPAVKKCPKCQAIINKEGKVLQIPQRIDFKISCPECDSSMSWEILERSEDKIKVRCSSCNKAYELTFDKKENPLVSKFFKLTRYFNYITEKMKGCKQCGHRTEIIAVDFDKNELGVRCANCGLKYRVNYLKAKKKRIIEVKEIELSSIIENIDGELEKRSEILMPEEIKDLELSDYSEGELEDLKDFLSEDENEEFEDSAKLPLEKRKTIPDSLFAVVIIVKDKRTGKPRKIRKYPIDTPDRVRSALRYLGMPRNQKVLQKMGISIDAVRKKILKRARQLKMTTLLERYKKGSELDLSKLPKEVTDCVKKKIKAGTKPAIAVKECWAEYKKAKGSVEDKDESAILEVIEDFENQLALSEIENKEEDAMTNEEKRALAERAKVVGLKEDASKEEVEKAEAKKKDLEHYEKENEDAKKAKLVERAKAVSLKEDATEEEIVKAEKAKADKAKTDELTKLKKEIEDLKKALKAKDAEIEKVRKDTAKLTARKIKLGEEKAKEMKDEDILNDDKFEKETLKIEKANLEKQLKDNKILPSGHEPEGEEKDALEVANEYVNELAYGTEESQE